MTDKNITPDGEEPEAQTRETTEKPPRPPMSKASFEAEPTPAGSTQDKTEAEVQAEVKTDGRANGRTAADEISMEREALLQVDSYAEAEALLSERPDLIEQARTLFGAIVPTTGQNEFIDLAIRAAAEDDAMSLGDALRAKRHNHLNLTAPEVGQLLEFAQENMGKFPLLALYIALLLTDDLTRLEEAGLWQQQKTITLTTEKDLDLDTMALWEEISAPEPTVEPVAVEPVPIKAEAVAAPPEEKKRPAPPPPPVRDRQRKKVKGARPPRWVRHRVHLPADDDELWGLRFEPIVLRYWLGEKVVRETDALTIFCCFPTAGHHFALILAYAIMSSKAILRIKD